MGYDVNNDTTLLYGYRLPIAKLARLPYLTEIEAWGERRKCENRVLDWGAVKLRCPSLALMAAERLPRERDIDGVARYCFKKIARELLSAVIKPTKKPRFYYVKTATGG